MDNSTIWILLGLIILIVLIAVVMLLSKQRTQARAEAGELRERAAGSEHLAEDREAEARATQEQAHLAEREATEAQQAAAEAEREAAAAQERAQTLDARAEHTTREARAERDHVTDTHLAADDIDPDTKR